MMPSNLIVILGPTASGKTRLAARLAHHLQSEVISADSRQVYRNMNIGTGKDYQDHIVNGHLVKHHLIDIVNAGEQYHVHAFMEDFFSTYIKLKESGMVPVLCGGSGMYIDAVLRNFEYTAVPNNHELRRAISFKPVHELLQIFYSLPQTAYTHKADLSTGKRIIRAIEISYYLLENTYLPQSRPLIEPVIFGLLPDLTLRRNRIRNRLEQRLEGGLIEEVRALHEGGLSYEQLAYYGLEYKFVAGYLGGQMSYEALKELLGVAIQQFAKRQMTYFRKMERDGHVIHWIDAALKTDEQLDIILQHLKGN